MILLDVNNVVGSPFTIVDSNYMDLSNPHVKKQYDYWNSWLDNYTNYKNG